IHRKSTTANNQLTYKILLRVCYIQHTQFWCSCWRTARVRQGTTTLYKLEKESQKSNSIMPTADEPGMIIQVNSTFLERDRRNIRHVWHSFGAGT
uniref:Uncharacterized protein n=1 Tax=Dromaius novaehollandiae TaxID=8790 RepID=A0A8C4P799_DRONO